MLMLRPCCRCSGEEDVAKGVDEKLIPRRPVRLREGAVCRHLVRPAVVVAKQGEVRHFERVQQLPNDGELLRQRRRREVSRHEYAVDAAIITGGAAAFTHAAPTAAVPPPFSLPTTTRQLQWVVGEAVQCIDFRHGVAQVAHGLARFERQGRAVLADVRVRDVGHRQRVPLPRQLLLVRCCSSKTTGKAEEEKENNGGIGRHCFIIESKSTSTDSDLVYII